MANEFFRGRIMAEIKHALHEAQNAASHDHPGLRGRVREIIVEKLIKPLLPLSYAVGTGIIVDGAGGRSAETDIVIYSRELLPPLLYSDRDGVFPVEACVWAIEIKSQLTATELKSSIQKARILDALLYSPGYHDERGNPQEHIVDKVRPLLFALSSDLAIGGKSELKRYWELDMAANPAIPNLCVVGRGFWWEDKDDEWCVQPATDEHDEVLIALAMIVNSLAHVLSSRGQPRFGWYILPNGSRLDMRVKYPE